MKYFLIKWQVFVLLCYPISRTQAQVWDSLPLPCSNISIATLHHGAIFVANGNDLGLFKSTDDATAWSRVANFPGGKITFITSVNNQLYVSKLNPDGQESTYRSNDNGNTWLLTCTGGAATAKAYRTDTIFSAIGNGVVVRYLPGGATDTVFSQNNLPINRLLNIGSDLWLVRPGEIWHSANGAQWDLLPTPPPAQPVTGLYYFQNAVFYSGGGLVYRSADAGASWSLASIPTGLQGNLLNMTDLNGILLAGISTGTGSHFLRSTDGGITWSLAYKGIHPARQWLVDGPRWVIRTDAIGMLASADGGATWWDANYGLPDSYSYDYCRLENGVRLCNGVSKGIFRSTDEGQSWEYVLRRGEGTLAARGNKAAFLAYDSLYTTSDGGLHWSVMPYMGAQNKHGIWVDDTHLLYGDNGNPDYICDLTAQTCQNTYPVGNVTAARGRMIGVSFDLFNHKDVVVSDDLGATWKVVGDGTIPPWNFYPYKIFSTDSVVIARSEEGAIFISKDNGDTWQAGGSGLPAVNDVFWGHIWKGWGRNVGVVFEYSTDGQGYFSNDFGATWTGIYTPGPLTQGALVNGNASSEGIYYLNGFNGLLQIQPGLTISPGRVLRFGNFSENAVRGLVFNDQNNNGLRDAGEAVLPNVPVWLKKTGAIAATDAQGFFAVSFDDNLLPDTLTIEPFGSLDDISPAFYVVNGTQSNLDFGLHFDDDVAISINSGSDPKPGYFQNLIIHCQNTGTTTQTGMLKLLPDPLLIYIANDTLPAPVISGDTLIWDLGILQPFEDRSFKVLVQVDSAAVFGDTLSSIAILCLDMPDLAASNDRDTLIQAVVASFDPNDKAVAEGARISPEQAEAREALHYRIRFQNTGNFPAFQVVIQDTLSAGLDAASIRLLAASHPCQMVLSETNIASFRFNPIYLPDSLTNEPDSHGFVEYSIKPKPGLVLGDVLQNTAFIYFDANFPVKTNTVQTVVSEISKAPDPFRTVESLQLTPNPTGGLLTIHLTSPAEEVTRTYIIEVFDAQGRMVLTKSVVSNAPLSVSVENMAPGLHWVVVRNGHFKATGKFIRL